MKIVCLGWGSLIWRPESLPLAGSWEPDGPSLPVEFARHSKLDRVTLVLLPETTPVQVLWATLTVSDVHQAREALRTREDSALGRIGVWSPGSQASDPYADIISAWAKSRQMDGVVWTAIGPKWNDTDGQIPTSAEVVAFLRKQGPGSKAEEYVRRAPRQVNTPYRQCIEQDLGWSCTSTV